MSRARFIFIVIMFVIIALVGWYFVTSQNQGTPDSGDESGFSSFLPFGKSATITPSGGDETPASEGGETEEIPSDEPVATGPHARLWQVTTEPVAGAIMFEKKRLAKDQPTLPPEAPVGTPLPAPVYETATAIRYMESGTAHVFDVFADTGMGSRISNTTIPRIHEAVFGKDGSSAILRFLDSDATTIRTYSATITTPDTTTAGTGNLQLPPLAGSFLSDNIYQTAVSPDGTKLFSLIPFDGGVAGDISGIDGSKKIRVFTSSFHEWTPSWYDNRHVLLTTKPSGAVGGFVYILDTQTKIVTRLLGGITGLTGSVSPDGKLFLYSEGGVGTMKLGIMGTDGKTGGRFDIGTLPEKCVWAKTSTAIYCAAPSYKDSSLLYPDVWYQGSVSFNDALWKIDVSTGSTTELDELSAEEGIDATNLKLNAAENKIIFTNKKDGSLWAFDLIPPAENA